jgi:predicted nuclease of restriction endonuclease-like (RecB) superfamily
MNSINIKGFKKWVNSISAKYKQSQIKAAIKVNSEMLSFYFELGKEISYTSFKAEYGSRFYDNLSKELIKNLPNVTGLSPKNLRYMEKFYLLYKDKLQIFPQLVGQLFSVPWGHHRYIIDKCKNVDEALFFVNEVHKNNWSRDVLLNFLDTNLYKRDSNDFVKEKIGL